jgi:peptidoglycan/LPS O-acetylase OafA/YrhL
VRLLSGALKNKVKETGRSNNFGFLRLLFAMLVIVSHSPELIDGNRSREILTRIFGTLSFGAVSVLGFFIISGYLITKSWVETSSLRLFLLKRVLRIFPGYLVSYWICLVFLGPFVGDQIPDLSLHFAGHNLLYNLLLLEPGTTNAFHGLPGHLLNGSIWTIAYEFRCYIAAAILGLVGCYSGKARIVVIALGACLILLNLKGYFNDVAIKGDWAFGTLAHNVDFAAAFIVGQAYYVFRGSIRYTHFGAFIAAVTLIGLLFSTRLAESAFMIVGGYLIFWFAFKVPVLTLSRANNKVDISYGTYLYAWPIQNLIIWNDPSVNPWVLCLIALPSAGLFGLASWTFIEKPALALFRTRFTSGGHSLT